ncbi:MAG: hypothetical protein ABIO70_28855 [Pseudomonadota bacterium]
MSFLRSSLTAKLLVGAFGLLMVVHLVATLLDGDFRSVQATGGLWGLPRWLSPLSLAAGLLFVTPLLRYLELRHPRLVWLRWAFPLLVLVPLLGLLYDPAGHPFIAAFDAAVFWVGLGLCIQLVNLNHWLGTGALKRWAASTLALASLVLVWGVHYAIFDAQRSSWRARLREADPPFERGDWDQALQLVAEVVDGCPVPAVVADARELDTHVHAARRDAILEEARGALGGEKLDRARETLVGFLDSERLAAYRSEAEALLLEVGEALGERYLREAAAAEEQAAWDEALEKVRSLLVEVPGFSRIAEASAEEQRLERQAARACQDRLVQALAEGRPEDVLELARAAPTRYPDALADTDLPHLLVEVIDAMVGREMTRGKDLEAREQYDEALAVFGAIAVAYPESSILREPRDEMATIRSLAKDPAAIWARSYFIRERNPFSIFGKNPEWLLANIDDLQLRDPTKEKLVGNLLTNCREVHLEGKKLYLVCYSSWKGKLIEIYVRFGEGIDMNGIVQATVARYGSKYRTYHGRKDGAVFVWSLDRGRNEIHITPGTRKLIFYNKSLHDWYGRDSKR